MENSQSQIEYPQSHLRFKSSTKSEEDEHELPKVYNRYQGGRRKRTPGFPNANDSTRCQ